MIPPIRDSSSSIVPHLNHQHCRICSQGIGGHPSSLHCNPRLTAHAANSCWETFTSIPKQIGTFFYRRFADVQMFFKACRGNGVTNQVVDQRFNEVGQLIQVINTYGANRNAVKEQFRRLSNETRNLFYYLDENYIDQFVNDPSRTQEIREEMIRECEQVVFLQKLFNGRVLYPPLALILPGMAQYDRNAIPADIQQKADEINRLKIQFAALGLRFPTGIIDPTTLECMAIPVFDSSHPVLQNAIQTARINGVPTQLDRSWLHLLDKDSLEALISAHPDSARCPTCGHTQNGGIQRNKVLIDTVMQNEILQFLRNAVVNGVTTTSTTTTTTSTTRGTEVPGTVPYVQNAIPADVQNKANEINRLKPLFDALRPPPAVPLIYNDPVGMEIFSIPVFDVSHPTVQNALQSGVSTSINNRDLRHLIEKDSLERHIAAGRSWAPAKCIICRHPEHGGIRRDQLRIDTALQDEILQFLRNATRP